MVDYSVPSGTRARLILRDDGNLVTWILSLPGDTFTSDIPWAYTVNGATVWGAYTLPNRGEDPNVEVALFSRAVSYSQTVAFLLGDTNSTELGGPTELYQYVTRGAGGATVNLQVGNAIKKAIPYVNVGGVWREAEPWSAYAGVWKQTT